MCKNWTGNIEKKFANNYKHVAVILVSACKIWRCTWNDVALYYPLSVYLSMKTIILHLSFNSRIWAMWYTTNDFIVFYCWTIRHRYWFVRKYIELKMEHLWTVFTLVNDRAAIPPLWVVFHSLGKVLQFFLESQNMVFN